MGFCLVGSNLADNEMSFCKQLIYNKLVEVFINIIFCVTTGFVELD